MLLSYVKIFPPGGVSGAQHPYCILGAPHISEISRDRKLKCYKRLGRVKYFFRV